MEAKVQARRAADMAHLGQGIRVAFTFSVLAFTAVFLLALRLLSLDN